jgi:predicted DCC family thiol-disulfide oxidoreductase YuxK
MKVPETFPGIRIAPPDRRGILLYDGDCGFCAKSARWFQSHARTPVAVEPAHHHLPALPPQVAATALHQVLWISPQGEIEGGSQAIIQALKATGHPIQSALLQAAQPLTRQAYRFLATHRPTASSCRPTT